jgi:hypothetical protein
MSNISAIYLYVENELEFVHFYFDTIWLGNKYYINNLMIHVL